MGRGQPSLSVSEDKRSGRFCPTLPFLPDRFGCSVSGQRKGFLLASVPAAFVKVAAAWEVVSGLSHPPRHLFVVNCQ